MNSNAGNWLRKYTKGILKRTQKVILPSLLAYEVRSIAVAIQKNTKERTEETARTSLSVEASGFALIGNVIPPTWELPTYNGIPEDITVISAKLNKDLIAKRDEAIEYIKTTLFLLNRNQWKNFCASIASRKIAAQ